MVLLDTFAEVLAKLYGTEMKVNEQISNGEW
jgi:hypothetical protein